MKCVFEGGVFKRYVILSAEIKSKLLLQ